MILAQPQPVPSLCLLLLRKLQLNRDSSGKSRCLSKELLLSPHVARTLHISKEQHLRPCPMQASAWIRASQKLQPLLDACPEITELSPPLAFSSRHKPRQELHLVQPQLLEVSSTSCHYRKVPAQLLPGLGSEMNCLYCQLFTLTAQAPADSPMLQPLL